MVDKNDYLGEDEVRSFLDELSVLFANFNIVIVNPDVEGGLLQLKRVHSWVDCLPCTSIDKHQDPFDSSKALKEVYFNTEETSSNGCLVDL